MSRSFEQLLTSSPAGRIRIGQTWEQRTHKRAKPRLLITQVHRRDRQAEVVPVDGDGALTGEPKHTLAFRDLTKRYRLVSQETLT